MRLIAIDPASRHCGVAFFEDGKLTDTYTITSDQKTPLERRLYIAKELSLIINRETKIASEEPLLMGRNNNYMQRLLGYIELLSEGSVQFVHPLTVKSQIGGTGKAEKLDVALAAGELLKTEEEKERMAEIIQREAFDESDAVAVGLFFLQEKLN